MELDKFTTYVMNIKEANVINRKQINMIEDRETFIHKVCSRLKNFLNIKSLKNHGI